VKVAKTKEENFLIKLDQNLEDGEWIALSLLSTEWNMTSKYLKNIINQLAQANFIKKNKDEEICITPHGRKLAENLAY
jgi:predicted transcriptional regulator